MQRYFDYGMRAWNVLVNRPKGWRSLLFNTAMAKARSAGPLMLPIHITVEPTNACNLKCPVCETGNGSMARTTGLLKLEKFKLLIDQVAEHTSTLMFYFMGEPFLNKKSYEMIRYARDKGIYVETCTNGDFVDSEGVIYSDVNDISFQIGGMRQETHEVYRIDGDLARVQRNLNGLIQARRRNPDSNVKISVGFVVMKHNEHEVADFLSWAREIGVDQANVIDPCVRTIEEGERFLPSDRRYWFYDEESFARGVLRPKHVPDNECTWIWNSVTINWDGSIVPCCRDPNGRHVFGNVFEKPLSEIWNGKEMMLFRRNIMSRQSEIDICKLCSGYGVPDLNPSRPIDFEIKRLSLDESRLDIPSFSAPVNWVSRRTRKEN